MDSHRQTDALWAQTYQLVGLPDSEDDFEHDAFVRCFQAYRDDESLSLEQICSLVRTTWKNLKVNAFIQRRRRPAQVDSYEADRVRTRDHSIGELDLAEFLRHHLGQTEYRLLECLREPSGRALDRRCLFEILFPNSEDVSDATKYRRVLDCLNRLRHSLAVLFDLEELSTPPLFLPKRPKNVSPPKMRENSERHDCSLP